MSIALDNIYIILNSEQLQYNRLMGQSIYITSQKRKYFFHSKRFLLIPCSELSNGTPVVFEGLHLDPGEDINNVHTAIVTASEDKDVVLEPR